MKLVCEACGAKYSIDEDRVTGRKFKVRCQRCSHFMLVDDTEETASEAADSGVIDLRALASTFGPAKFSPAKSAAIGTADDLPTYPPAMFGEPMVLIPSRSRDHRLQLALGAVLALLAILGTILVLL